ncbi:MAG TPA: UvrD-helicase domain-containing protein [Streptosporangiaceae bacterium]
MNWMCSSLDAYRLVSNSDAHSPPMLGREATTFSVDMDYFSIAAALRTGDGLAGTIEFYPEEGKYHLDGHRKCGVRLDPQQTRDHAGVCPECHKPLTVGVLHRVAELADRPDGYRPEGAAGFSNLVQLPEIVGEILSVGPRSKNVNHLIDRLVAAFGPELSILQHVPTEDLARVGGSALGEAIGRLRRGEVVKDAGFDGEYGSVRLFQPGELDRAEALFDVPGPAPTTPVSDPLAGQFPGGSERSAPAVRDPHPAQDGVTALLDGLDDEQRAAATAPAGQPLLIVAGPGTGKTRTLTHRIAYQATVDGLLPAQFLAITFTRRAAAELRQRLAALTAQDALTASDSLTAQDGTADPAAFTVTTFHGLALRLLTRHHQQAGLPADARVADEAARLEAATRVAGSGRDGRRLLNALADGTATGGRNRQADLEASRVAFRAALADEGLIDVDQLITRAVQLLRDHPDLLTPLREQWPRISVDEYQDVDEPQYELLRLLAGPGDGLTVIGDPDQAIYGFRGADVKFFLRFSADHPSARTVQLTRNYRSSPAVVRAAVQAITPSTLVPGRQLSAVRPHPEPSAAAGPAIVLHEAATAQAEGTWIAAEIDRLIGGTSFHSLDSGRVDHRQRHATLGLSDIAVLYRTDAQTAPLLQALNRAGLPYQKGSHDRLARRPGVQDIVRELRLTAPEGSPEQPVLNGPGEEEVARQLCAAVGRLTALIKGGEAVDILAAGEVLTPLARRCGADLEQFLTEISLGGEADAHDPRADAVTLLTLHAAKGLEFEVVFIAGCERGLLPLWWPGPERESDDEERRLLFVAMTRARTRLMLSYAARRGRRGAGPATAGRAGPSPFLAAIDPALLTRAATVKRPAPDRQLRLL